MEWTDAEKLALQSKLQQFLEEANEALDVATILLEHQKYTASAEFLMRSAQAWCQIMAALQRVTPDSEKGFGWLENALSQWPELMRPESPALLKEVLNLSFGRVWNTAQIQRYDKLVPRYTRVVYHAEKQLETKLQQELATPVQREGYAQQKRRTRWRWGIVGGAFLLLIAGLYGVYRMQNPATRFITPIQIFWKSSQVSEFNEAAEQHQKIETKGGMAEYTFVLDPAQPISALRFDPVERENVTIEIETIRLLNEQGQILKSFDFTSGDPLWKSINAKMMKAEDGKANWRSTTHDPFLMSPEFEEIPVKQIQIRMKLFQRLFFLYWLLGYPGQ